jgi:tetratricopeptide (TPR) repeat protein
MRVEQKRDEAVRHLERGLAMERVNRIAEAVAHYRQAIADNPHLPEAHNALAFYYQRSGLLAKAVDEFRIVAGLEGDFLAFFNLGYVQVELEQYEGALDAFGQCLLLVPDDAAAHFEVALIHLALGDHGQALAHLELPLRSYPHDWEIHNLHGRCLIGLRRYDEAHAALVRAMILAGTPAAQAEAFQSLSTLQRHREFRSFSSVKDQLYAQDGVIYLGSARDDGLQVAEVQEFHFSYGEIGTTLQRLCALSASANWRFSAVVAADSTARPIAQALALQLQVPVRRVEELADSDRALLVFAIAREAEQLLFTLERMPCPTTAFCLALNWPRQARALPDVIGIVARGACSVPWEAELRRRRAEGVPAVQLAELNDAAAAAMLRAVRETPPDTNLPRQIRYYTRTHRRVNVQ